MDGCLSLEEITDKFSLYKLCCGRSWHIQGCDAVDGTGLNDGLDWLSRQLVASGVHDLGWMYSKIMLVLTRPKLAKSGSHEYNGGIFERSCKLFITRFQRNIKKYQFQNWICYSAQLLLEVTSNTALYFLAMYPPYMHCGAFELSQFRSQCFMKWKPEHLNVQHSVMLLLVKLDKS